MITFVQKPVFPENVRGENYQIQKQNEIKFTTNLHVAQTQRLVIFGSHRTVVLEMARHLYG